MSWVAQDTRNKIRLVCTLVWCQEAPRGNGRFFSAYFLCLLLENVSWIVRAVASREARGSLLGDLPLASGRASADAPWPRGIISLRGSNVKDGTTRSACAVRRYTRSLGLSHSLESRSSECRRVEQLLQLPRPDVVCPHLSVRRAQLVRLHLGASNPIPVM